MIIRCRPMRPKDVAGTVDLIAAHPVVAPRYGDSINQLRYAWLRLLGCQEFWAAVFEELHDAKVQMVGAAATVFVTDRFVRELKTSFFWIGPELAKRVTRGDSPVLSDSEVAEANTKGGLNLVLWHICIAPEEAKRTDIRTQISGSFVEQHRRYLLKEMIALQATFVEEAQWIADSGSLFLDAADGQYVNALGQHAETMIATPPVFGLTGELALRRMTWTTSLFLYEPPKGGFSPSEQRLLFASLRGGTDEELSDQLAISISAVKKAWHSVYERAGESLPQSILNDDGRVEHSNGERGKQKKQRLLAYLRDHPEELRPYFRKTRRESKVRLSR